MNKYFKQKPSQSRKLSAITMKVLYFNLIFFILLFSCNSRNGENTTKEVNTADSISAMTFESINDSMALTLTKDILTILKEKKYDKLIAFIDPDDRIRFSPYGYIDTINDLKLTAVEFLNYVTKDRGKKLHWGSYDGTGDSILLTLSEYLNKFAYDVNFINAEKISLNKILSSGNSLNNIDSIYKHCVLTESYFSGFEKKFDGMDWRSLILVYKKRNHKLYLVGIIHNQWTI